MTIKNAFVLNFVFTKMPPKIPVFSDNQTFRGINITLHIAAYQKLLSIISEG